MTITTKTPDGVVLGNPGVVGEGAFNFSNDVLRKLKEEILEMQVVIIPNLGKWGIFLMGRRGPWILVLKGSQWGIHLSVQNFTLSPR